MIEEPDPYEGMAQLPEHAPFRSLYPTRLPRQPELEQRLRVAGIDPTSASAIIAAIVGRGWSFRLVGSVHDVKPARYRVMGLEPRYHMMWAPSGDQPDPASAFAQVIAICLEYPPWEREEG